MKRAIPFLICLSIIGCATPNRDNASERLRSSHETQIIESTILWDALIDEVTWEPIELKELLKETETFTRNGYFYTVNRKLQVFGHQALYIGIHGIDLLPGPNVTVAGNPRAVADYIEKKYSLSFKRNRGEYSVDLREHIKLLILPHPERRNTSMVIGAYFGP